MIEIACQVVVQCCSSLFEETASSVLQSLGGPAIGNADPAAEVARLRRKSEIEQAVFDRYMTSREQAYDETSNEWVLTAVPLTHDPAASPFRAGGKMESKYDRR